MNKPNFTIEHLLADSSFIEYCLAKPSGTNPWDLHLQKYPEDQATFMEAKKVLLLLTAQMPEEIIEDKLNSFKKRFYQTNFTLDTSLQKSVRKSRQLFLTLGIAASLAFMVTGIFFFFKTSPTLEATFTEIKGQHITTSPTDRNSITLSDGTVAILYPTVS